MKIQNNTNIIYFFATYLKFFENADIELEMMKVI